MVDVVSTGRVFNGFEANEADPSKAQDLQKFLRFRIEQEVIGLLPANIVTAIIQIPGDEILPAPQMHPCVMGVYNWRSEIVWMVDLPYLLGYSPTERATDSAVTANLLVAIAKQQERILGLVIPKVEDLIELDVNEVHSPSTELFSGQSFPFLEGYFMSAEQEIMLLLKPDKIFALE
ncbi:MAG: chemotaxis protein CheW [Cyanobacteria bacterium J06641_5]